MLAQIFFKIGKKNATKNEAPKSEMFFWTCRLLGLDSKGPFIYAFIWANGANVLGISATCSLEPISAIPGMYKYIPSLKLTFSPLKIGLPNRKK